MPVIAIDDRALDGNLGQKRWCVREALPAAKGCFPRFGEDWTVGELVRPFAVMRFLEHDIVRGGDRPLGMRTLGKDQ